MSIEYVNPRELDVVIDIEHDTTSIIDGEKNPASWAAKYLGVKAKELKVLGNENAGINQVVGVQRKSFLIRAENRVIDNKMRVNQDQVYYYVTDFRNYKGSRNWRVIDCEFRDNINGN